MQVTAQQFLRAIGHKAQGQFTEVRLIGRGSEWYASPEALESDFQRLKGLGVDLYYGVCPRFAKVGTKAGVNTITCLWADLDGKDYEGGKEEALRVLSTFSVSPTAVIDSGNGYHAYWTLTQPLTLTIPQEASRIEAVLKGLAHALGADPSCAEVARILRLPSSTNYKNPTDPKPVSVVSLEADRRYDLRQFDEFVMSTPTQTAPHQSIAELVAGMGEGNHHAPLLTVAGRLIHRGLSYEDTLRVICSMAQAEGVSEREATDIVNYTYGKHSASQTAVSCVPASHTLEGGTQDAKPQVVGVSAYSFHDCMTRTATATPWMVQNVLPETGAGILAGLGYIGKSFVLMDLGLEVARGGVWLGQYPTKARPVVYVDQENSANEIDRRLRKLARGKGIEAKADLNMTIVTADHLPLDQPSGLETLRNVLKDKAGALVIVDSLIRVFNGDENSSRDMARLSQNVLRLCREFNCFCLLADHLGKNQSHGHGANLRGTTEKFAFCDVVFECERTAEGCLRLKNTKQRSGQPLDSFELRLRDPDTDSTVLEWVEPEQNGFVLDRGAEARDFVVSHIRERGETSRPLVVEAGKARGISKNRVDDALEELCPATLTMDHRLSDSTGKWTYYYRLAVSGEQVALSFVGEPAMT